MSLTELLERVDWRDMAILDQWEQKSVRHPDDLRCPLEVATDDVLYIWAAKRVTDTSGKSLDAVMDAADRDHSHTPGAARWRQWMVEQIAASQRVTR